LTQIKYYRGWFHDRVPEFFIDGAARNDKIRPVSGNSFHQIIN